MTSFWPPDPDRVFYEDDLVCCIWDAYPLNPGHALVVPKRNIISFWESTPAEREALLRGIDAARQAILSRHQADGFNVGWNDGQSAGQTIMRLHIHVIPRVSGDVPDPRGGIRWVIPEQAAYWESGEEQDLTDELARAPHEDGLVSGEDDPLLRHLAAYFPRAQRVDIAVAFVMERGAQLMRPYFEDLLISGGQLRLVTGDYFSATEPNALEALLDLPGDRLVRVFESAGQSFHPKAYIFHLREGHGIAFVGSSNMSRTALGNGVEWNYRVVRSRDQVGFVSLERAFDRVFGHRQTRWLTHDWIASYRKVRKPNAPEAVGLMPEHPEHPPAPHHFQSEALTYLRETRDAGNTSGLVVLATGLGKTWLSAFDSAGFDRMLFVAHREEILDQAMSTFRAIRPEAALGRFTGKEKTPDADVLFASVQTLGRATHLRNFAPDAFDYIIVDEFHHAAARTYRKLIRHFDPKFLLGLTATPERTDGADLLALCGHNLVYRADLGEGIRQDLLCPFRYVGVPDDVDYEQIPWRSNRFDEEELTKALATQRRAENALEQFERYAGKRALGFCCSRKHADFMAEFFRQRGKRAVSVHAGETSAPRANSMQALKTGDLDIVFSVDIFNEGIDVPAIDTVLMLRPTESRILWLQQLGRGLRKSEGKDHLRVIDYIGNHRVFLNKPQALLGALADVGEGHQALRMALLSLKHGELDLPPGCEVTYDLVDTILEELLRPTTGQGDLQATYEEFRLRHGRRPTAAELYGSRCLKKQTLRRAFGSWFGLVREQGDLEEPQAAVLEAHRDFLEHLEITKMTRSYKMLTLQAMVEANALPGTIGLDELASQFERIARRTPAFRSEMEASLGSHSSLEAMLRTNPIDKWATGKFFLFADPEFGATFEVAEDLRDTFADMVSELVDWRLEEYLDRPREDRFLCRVTHNERSPILMLPDRKRHPHLPEGPTPLRVDDDVLEGVFAKIALNVVTKPDDPGTNQLPLILRGWFGEDAGRPGRGESVVMELVEDGYRMSPAGSNTQSHPSELGPHLVVGRPYMREEIPPIFGETFVTTVWQQGFVPRPPNLFLLVTLEKGNMPEDHRYHDRFVSRQEFQWQSQNRTKQDSKHGRLIRDHDSLGLHVHLFVRRRSKRGQKAAPFYYCGRLRFERCEGERPITVWWHMETPLSDETAGQLGLA